MLQGFAAAFHPDSHEQGFKPWREARLMGAAGYSELTARMTGRSFDCGLYRFHDAESGPRGAASIKEALPDFSDRSCPFAYDWLGRQFALDADRSEHGDSLILLLEPGTGQALEIPLTFAAFHEQLDSLREPALAAGFFAEWSQRNIALLPLKLTDCVGYSIPLFLGGADTAGNLEVIDLDVYWSLCGQVRASTQRLPPGTSVRGVVVDEG